MFLVRARDALFPSFCIGCGRLPGALCTRCRPEPAQRRMIPFGDFDVFALGRYAGVLRRAILAYKRGRSDVGEALAGLLAERIAGELPLDALLVPVPTVLRRSRERGYDQSVRLARGLEAGTERAVILALRQTAGDAQRGRSRDARLATRGRFACVAPHLVEGADVVLVDDVMTTGATLRDCARSLEAAGAVVGGAVVLAYA
ncbi:MAG: ComF family protein [Vulcanimicrobiaceae bacterium]